MGGVHGSKKTDLELVDEDGYGVELVVRIWRVSHGELCVCRGARRGFGSRFGISRCCAVLVRSSKRLIQTDRCCCTVLAWAGGREDEAMSGRKRGEEKDENKSPGSFSLDVVGCRHQDCRWSVMQ